MQLNRPEPKTVVNVDDYPNLRAYLGSANQANVTDPNGTGVRGTFVRVSFGDENGGTLLVDAAGRRWMRMDVGSEIQTGWWEIGDGPKTIGDVTVQTGYDHKGKYYDPDNHTNGEGVRYFNDQFNSAHYVGGEGATIVFPENQDLSAFGPLNANEHSPQRINMRGSSVNRPNEEVLTLTADHLIGSNQVQLTSLGTPPLRVGEYIQVSNGTPAASGHRGQGRIDAIDTNTNTVTLHTPANKTIAAAGSVVTRSHDLMRCKNEGASTKDWKHESIELFNGKFDGNQANNQSIKSWDLAGNIDNVETWMHVHHVEFDNTPSENIRGTLGIYEFLRFGTNLGGSALHFSHGDEKTRWSIVRFNKVLGPSNNRGGYNYLGHSEGLWTSSAHGFTKVWFEGNEALFGGPGDVYGHADEDLFDFVSLNNRYAGFRNIIFHSSSQVEKLQGNFVFVGNTCDKCGDFRLLAKTGSAAKGRGLANIRIENNVFINTRFSFWDAAKGLWRNNQTLIDWDNPPDWSVDWTSQKARILFYNCSDWDCDGSGHWLETADPDNLAQRNGISCQGTIKLKDDQGNDTKFLWSANMRFYNWNVRGYLHAFTPMTKDPNIKEMDHMVAGHELFNNHIVMHPTADTQSAIQWHPRAKIYNNTVDFPAHIHHNQRGIIVHSIHDATDAETYSGSQVYRNDLSSASGNQVAILVGTLQKIGTTEVYENAYNALVHDNIISTSIDDNGVNTQGTNTTVAFASRTTPAPPPAAEYGLNQGVY